jgi:hypothetical protein
MQILDAPDSRPVIEKLRRFQLREICLKKGISLPGPLPTAEVMRAMIQAEGGLREVMSRPDRPTPKMDARDTGSEISDEDMRKYLEGLPMPKIRQACKERGVVFRPSDKKAALVERLLEPGQ